MCAHEDAEKVPPGTAGLEGYTTAPFNAWSGWRYRIPGGPIGGQYHGYIGPDDSFGAGWPAGHDEIMRPVDNPAGLGGMPWHGWDDNWGGIPLNEGETVSDYVYRGPAEMRPRPNASGGANTVRAVQTRRSAGYAVAPGNYRGLGALVDNPIVRGLLPGTVMRTPGGPIPYPGPIREPMIPIDRWPPRACPAWGCGPPPIRYVDGGPQPSPVVTQPPPPVTPQPAPITASGCPTGQYRDAAGNCTADWSHPSPLYLPPDQGSPQPSPTVSANTCPTGYTQDPSTGNCYPPGAAPSGSGIMAWLGASTTIGGVNIPNAAIAGVGALLAIKMFGGRR